MFDRANGQHASAMPFDVIVVGAGINGAGIARDAASRGLRVALLEKDDISSGTSSWSGRLIHGGLRYLEHRDFRLVRESLRERERLFRLAPHLVKPISLLMPFYEGNKRPPWMIRAGMIAYDVLSWDKAPPRHSILSREQVLKQSPGVSKQGLSGGALFTDGQVTYPERLCVELAVAAYADGAIVQTYSRVDTPIVDNGKVRGVHYTDTITGTQHELYAPVVVNAAGPWVDHVLASENGRLPRLIGGTKGSHLVVDRFPGAPDEIVYFEAHTDGRLVLIVPWNGRYLIGCTDIRYEEDPGDVRADADEVDYILSETNRVIPEANLTTASCLYTYSGVRPLPHVPNVPEGSVPRGHIVHDHAPDARGLLSIVGGKLTTYRSLAEQTVDKVFRELGRKPLRCTTRHCPLPGANVADLEAFRETFVAYSGLPAATAERLVEIYGVRATGVLQLGANSPELLEPFNEQSGAIGAELVFAVESEFARTLADVLMRRTMIGLEPGQGLDSIDRAAEILGKHLNWDAEQKNAEVEAYRRYLKRFSVPIRDERVETKRVGEATTSSSPHEKLES